MNRLTIGSIVTATLLLVGCGSDGSSSKSSLTDSSTPTNSGVENPVVAQKVGKGYYVDSAVEGVHFQCGNESGVTDENGTFTFESGSDCNFTIGGINLRDINASLLEDNITILETNTTVAQLLQTLDIDGNASNGIQISLSSDSVVQETIPSVDDLNQDLLEAVHARLKAEHSDEYNGTVVDKNQTVAHLNATKADLKDRNIRTHLDVEAEHRGTTENNGSVVGSIDTAMGNMSGSHTEEGSIDSNNSSSAHVDTNGTMSVMGNMTGNHSAEGDVDSNSNASAHVDTNGAMSTMGNMTGSHNTEGDVDSNSNASAHVDTEGTMSTMGNMTGNNSAEGSVDSNNNASAHVDTNGAMGDVTGNHSIKADIDSNNDASAHVDTNGTMSTMGNMIGNHSEEGDIDSNNNASAHVDTNSTIGNMSNTGNMTASHNTETNIDSNNNASNIQEEHSGSASAQTETHSNSSSNSSSSSSESSSSSSVTGAMGGFGRR